MYGFKLLPITAITFSIDSKEAEKVKEQYPMKVIKCVIKINKNTLVLIQN